MNSQSQSGVREKRTRHPNLTMREEIVLCEGYVKITPDGNKGTDQASSTFWERVAAYYHNCEGVSDKPVSPVTLQKKFSIVSGIVTLYVACLTSVEHASGTSPADWVNNAPTKFQENNGKAFPKDHAFNVLRVLPRFNPGLTRRQSEINGEGSSEESPLGRKGEKERQRMNNSKHCVQEAETTIESTNAFMQWHKQAHREKETRKLEFQQTWERQRKYEADTHVLYMNTTHMTPMQLAIHSREVDQIIARRNAEATPPPSMHSQSPGYTPQGYTQPQGFSPPQDATPLYYSGLICSSNANAYINEAEDEEEEDKDYMN